MRVHLLFLHTKSKASICNSSNSLTKRRSFSQIQIASESKNNCMPPVSKLCHSKSPTKTTTKSHVVEHRHRNSTQIMTTPHVRNHNDVRRTKELSANSILYPFIENHNCAVIVEEDSEVDVAVNGEHQLYPSGGWQHTNFSVNSSFRSSQLGSDNLLVTFDYGFSDSIEMQMTTKHLYAQDEHMTFTIREAPAAALVEADECSESIVLPPAEHIWYTRMQEVASGVNEQNVAAAFQVHHMKHNANEVNDNSMMSFASYSSYPEYEVDSIT